MQTQHPVRECDIVGVGTTTPPHCHHHTITPPLVDWDHNTSTLSHTHHHTITNSTGWPRPQHLHTVTHSPSHYHYSTGWLGPQHLRNCHHLHLPTVTPSHTHPSTDSITHLSLELFCNSPQTSHNLCILIAVARKETEKMALDVTSKNLGSSLKKQQERSNWRHC